METSIKTERWKEIDFETNLSHDKYEVSHLGRVKSYAIDKERGSLAALWLTNNFRVG